jgi:hypothetical protein
MVEKRKGEDETELRFRTDRFIHNGDKWYYETREGKTEGPFPTKPAAEEHLRNYVKMVNSGWWNDEAGGLKLEPSEAVQEPVTDPESKAQTWAVRRGR